MKKVLQVLAQKPGTTGSGVYFQALIREMKKKGYPQGAIAAITQEEFRTWEGEPSISFYPVVFESENIPFPIAGMSDHMPYRSSRYDEMNQEMHQCWKQAFQKVVDQAVKEFQPDIIISHHLWLLSAYIKAWYPEIPMIAISHGTDIRQLGRSKKFAQEVIRGCSRIETIFALNQYQQNQIHQNYGIQKERILVMGNGYNGDLFYPNPGEKAGKDIRLVYTGKICNAKGVPSLIRAFDLLKISHPRIGLTLIGGGDGEEFEQIQELAQSMEKPITFTGILPQEEVAEIFRESDIFILPSFYEGLPLVLLEALACGLKVVTSDLPGIREWIGERINLRSLISYVRLPRIKQSDQPVEEDLPSYERDLAHAMEHRIKNLNRKEETGINHQELENLREWSWEQLFERMETYL